MIVTLKEAESRLNELIDLAYKNREEIIINKDKNQSVAIISLDEYNSLKNIENRSKKEAKLNKFMEFAGAFEMEDKFKDKNLKQIKEALIKEKYGE